MELNPKQAIENLLTPIVGQAQRIGDTVLRQSGELLGVFTRPEVASANAAYGVQESKTMHELSDEVERNVGNLLLQREAAKMICADTVALLKIPEADRSEDDIIDLKVAAFMFDTHLNLMLGITDLSDEDTSVLSNFVMGLQT